MTDSPQQAQRDHSGASPGTMLREAREAANLTHAAVGEALHLTAHYIRSLENDEYNKLPGLIFVKGYIKSYGRFLKLDIDALLALYEERVQDMPAVQNQTLAGNYTRKRNDQAIGWAIAATLVILVGLGIGWWFVGRDDKPAGTTQVQLYKSQPVTRNAASSNNADEQGTAANQPNSVTDASATGGNDAPATAAADAASVVPTAADAAPAAAPASQNAPAAVPASATDKISVTPAPAGGRQINMLNPGPDQLQMSFGSNSWVEVDDSSGKRLYAEMLHSGDNLLLQGRAPFQVLLGDARHVKVNFNAAPVDFSSSIRNDFTARLTMNNPGNSAPPLAEAAAGSSRTAGLNH